MSCRNSPIAPDCKVDTRISRHSACDADLKALAAKEKIILWIKEAIDIIPEPIKVGSGNSYVPQLILTLYMTGHGNDEGAHFAEETHLFW